MTHLEVLVLGSGELLQVVVEHEADPGDQLGPQERGLDVQRQVVEGGERLVGQTEVGAAVPLVLLQLLSTQPLHLLGMGITS